MTWRKREIMEMAREAGAIEMRDNDSMGWGCEFELHQLEAFAKLVDDKATAREHEAIIQMMPGGNSVDPQWVCDAIRARGDKHD